MGTYLKLFNLISEYQAYISDISKMVLPNVSVCKEGDTLINYQPYVVPIYDYSLDYLTIESLEDSNIISFKASNSNLIKTISVSTDNGSTWTDKTSDTTGVTLATLNTGDKLLIKGSNTDYSNSSHFNYFTSTGEFNVSGNIMSLLHGDNFIGQTTLSGSNIFKQLFYNCTKLISAENFILPATTLVYGCYQYMFSGCTSLTTAPELPATTLKDYCYQYMFSGCTSLTTAPELPATTLAYCYYCYNYMFNGCTSLTTAPELPATTLADYCYQNMFSDCTSLTTAPELPATKLADYCYQNMFSDCTSLTTAPELPATALTNNCYQSMFSGCTSLTSAPELPATILSFGCYASMFYRCTSLTTAPELPATTLRSRCYEYMFYYCTSLNYVKCLATDISANNCTSNWLNYVASTGTFVKADNMTSWTTGANGIPNNWSQISVSELPITWDYTSSCAINSPIKPKLINPFNLPITYSSSDINVATIDNSGNVIFVSEGTVTLTAVFVGNETYQAKTATCQIQINPNDYKYDYLTIESLEDSNTISFKASNNNVVKTISVSTDNGSTWTNKQSNTTGVTLATLNTGDKLLIKGVNNTYYSNSSYFNYFVSTGEFNVSGNIMSLLYYNFNGQTTLSSSYTFKHLFSNCTKLKNAEHLVLPATTLADYCYQDMFNGCTSLTTAPELPATTLTTYCYNSMFYGCTSLTTAPELPATTLASYCYQHMFSGCTSLNYVKCLATNISASSCTSYWLNNVASTGTFVKADNMTSWSTGSNGIPSGWVQINNSAMPITWNNNEGYLVSSSDKPTLINPLNLPVTYSSSDTNVATIDSNGDVTFITTGTTTLTAVFEGNETYQAKTATCTLIIREPIILCTLYDSSNNVLTQIEDPSTTLTQSLVSSYKSSTYKVIISSECTSIGTDTFKQFTNLRSITISSNVSTIGNNAFASCSSLKEIICNRTTAPSLGSNNVFSNIARGGVLITPSGSSGYTTWMSTSYYLGYYQWYNAVGTFGDTEPTLQWSNSSYTITSDYFSTPSLSKQSGISVTYKSSNTSVATINSSGKVSKGSNGTTYIQAIFAGNSTYKPKVAIYTLTVNIYTGGSSGGGGGGE